MAQLPHPDGHRGGEQRQEAPCCAALARGRLRQEPAYPIRIHVNYSTLNFSNTSDTVLFDLNMPFDHSKPESAGCAGAFEKLAVNKGIQ